MYDQSDTEVDVDVFEEIVHQSPGTFRVMLSNKEDPGNHQQFTDVYIFNLEAGLGALEFA